MPVILSDSRPDGGPGRARHEQRLLPDPFGPIHPEAERGSQRQAGTAPEAGTLPQAAPSAALQRLENAM